MLPFSIAMLVYQRVSITIVYKLFAFHSVTPKRVTYYEYETLLYGVGKHGEFTSTSDQPKMAPVAGLEEPERH